MCLGVHDVRIRDLRLHGHGHDIRGAESRLGLGELRRYYYLSRLQPNCSIRTAIYILPRNGLPIRVVSYITSLGTSTLGGDVNFVDEKFDAAHSVTERASLPPGSWLLQASMYSSIYSQRHNHGMLHLNVVYARSGY